MKHAHSAALLATLFVLLAACASQDKRADVSSSSAVLFDDLGHHHRTVTTRSPDAQRWFDQGLTLVYSFNHDEAIRSFTKAARIDPECAMAWWGIALANGPHINFPMVPPEKAAAAWEALGKARAFDSKATPIERELIDALGKRYAEHQPDDRAPLDLAYAEAMRKVWRAHSNDADVGTLCAEALMDLQPWNLWTSDGKPIDNEVEIQKMLESVLALAPDHPGANHLYIHVVEASPDPAKGVRAADRLRTLVPGASHMVHMPAHIYARIGRYADAAEANERAILVDTKKRARAPRTGFYQVYMAHNDQFLSFVAMMQGRSQRALEEAHRMVDGIPPEFLEQMGPIIDGFLPIVLHGLVRFGRWDEVLSQPEFPPLFGCANSVRHYARGVALTALGRTEEAQKELDELNDLVKAIGESKDEITIGNNPAKLVLQIPQKVLAGELEFKRGKHDEGIALLREAVAVEDQLKYDEPPDWMMPARHTLGAALVQAGRFADAEKVYREDLKRWPENGWSLFGLEQSLAGQGRKDEAAAVHARFAKAWSQADVKLSSSCFCQPGA